MANKTGTKTPVLIQESLQPGMLGDVTLYRDLVDAENSLEAVDVRNREYRGYTLDGRALQMSVSGNSVRIVPTGHQGDSAGTVRQLLESYASVVLTKQNRGSDKAPDLANLSIDELAEVIGFAR